MKVGDIVTINGKSGPWYQGFSAGEKVRVIDLRSYGGQFEATNGSYSQLLHPTHIVESEVVEVGVPTTALVVESKPRVKYLYSVQDESGYPILNTRDREYAREFKTQLGGKKEGIIIMAYAPVKEIR